MQFNERVLVESPRKRAGHLALEPSDVLMLQEKEGASREDGAGVARDARGGQGVVCVGGEAVS